MKNPHSILYLFIIFAFCSACDHDNNQTHEFQFMKFPSDTPEGRFLSSSTRQSIRIHPILYLDWASEETASKIRDHMVPAVISYFEATLKVQRLTSNLVISKPQLEKCEVSFAPEYITTEGVPADFVVFIDGDLANLGAMANSKTYILHESTNRPLVGRFSYNRIKNWEGLDDFTYELHLITTLHEFMHMLGFSKRLYEHYINPETDHQMDYVAVGTRVNDYPTQLLKLQSLNAKIRAYFNCPTIEGAYLENEGTSQSQASHFERRVFYNEIMTAAAVEDRRISEFSLAVLEGSGWYTPDYTMSEPIFWGKNAGCSFLNEKCIDENKKARFNEFFCDNRGESGCTFTGESKGACGPHSANPARTVSPAFDYFGDKVPMIDPFSDNCPYYRTVDHISCDNPSNQDMSLIPGEKFGAGSMCFSGTLSKGEELGSPALYCMKKTCEERGQGDFALGIEVEGKKYYCASGESIEIKGYNGRLNCPKSVNEYCSTKGLKYCKRGCMGRGVCQNGECICNPGFEGPGCSRGVLPKSTNTDNSETRGTTSGNKDKEIAGNNKTETLVASEDNNGFSVSPLAVIVVIIVISVVVLVVRKWQYGQRDLDQTIEGAVRIKPEYSVVKTEENVHNVIEVETIEANEQIESQPNQQETGREDSENIEEKSWDNKIKEGPSAAFGNQKAHYSEL